MNIHVIIASFLSGILCSMGFGGGTVMIIYLSAIMHFSQTKSQGINLMFFVPMAIYSIIIYARKKLINLKAVLFLASGGIIGVTIGYFMLQRLEGGYLSKLFGIFLIFTGINGLLKSKKLNTRTTEC